METVKFLPVTWEEGAGFFERTSRRFPMAAGKRGSGKNGKACSSDSWDL